MSADWKWTAYLPYGEVIHEGERVLDASLLKDVVEFQIGPLRVNRRAGTVEFGAQRRVKLAKPGSPLRFFRRKRTTLNLSTGRSHEVSCQTFVRLGNVEMEVLG